MRFTRSAVALGAIALLGTTGSVQAQEATAAPSDDVEAAVQQKVASAESDREAIRSVLDRPQVRDVASRHGVDLDRAAAAVETLEGSELSAAAEQARDLDAALTNDTTIVISTTAIIIGLLILILIMVS